MNPVIHLPLQIIFGPKHGLVKIFSGMKLELSYLGTKRQLSKISFRKQARISMFSNLLITILTSTT